MKRIVNLGVVVILLVTLFSCNKKSGSEVTIGFLIHSTSSSRWQMDIGYIYERAEEVGVEVIMKNAEGDENQQLKQANELLEQGVDALLVVAANQNTAAGIVRDAHDYGVPVISYDRLIKNSDLDYLVSFEYEKVGTLMIDYVANRVDKGNCIILWGDASDANAIFVKRGHEKAIKALGSGNNIDFVYKTFVEGWKYENAYHLMNQILDFYPDKIDAVIACNDPLGLGAFDALSDHGYKPDEVVITGQDATLEFVHSMLEDGMTMSVSKPLKELAYGSVDLIVELVKTGTVEGLSQTVNNGRVDVPAKLFDPYVVDETNFESILIGEGVYTREEVFVKK
ncbi:MAG: substrate-binding domain-containing protein [Prolixibacteraceae bacterium]|nr:substrate-binding domain-containing protein [Prolixibacteraceae bacterium]